MATDSLRTHCSLKILHLLPKTGTSKEGHGAQSCATHPHARLGIWPRPHWVQSPKDDFVQSTRHRGPGIPNQRRIGSFVSSPQSTAAAPPPCALQQLTAAFRRGKSVLEIKNQTQAAPNKLCHPIQSPGALQSSRGFAVLLPRKAAAETPQRVAWVGAGGGREPGASEHPQKWKQAAAPQPPSAGRGKFPALCISASWEPRFWGGDARGGVDETSAKRALQWVSGSPAGWGGSSPCWVPPPSCLQGLGCPHMSS